MSDARRINPDDIVVPPEYQVDVFASGLNVPINLMFTDAGDLLVADAGVTDGNGKVLKRTDSGFTVIADGFTPPLTGINTYQGNIYVSHRGTITVVWSDGQKQDILRGLPSWGDHHNNRVVFGADGKMYWGQGTATNSGVVGEDNDWVEKYPMLHDYPGARVRLTGQNFTSRNVFALQTEEQAVTGAFVPFGVTTRPGQSVRGIVKATGSILRANPDGSQLELVAWGLRNPFRIRFNRKHRLYATSHGMDERGSRPVANSPDEFHRIRPGVWYGWPDYSGGHPVTLPRFQSEGKEPPQFLLADHPMQPPSPLAVFPPHSAAMGFDFGPDNDVYVAEFGQGGPGTAAGKHLQEAGHRVSRIDLRTGQRTRFAFNRAGGAATDTGGGGLERPIDVEFGPDGAMYVLDMGISKEGGGFVPNTGVIWRIRRRG